MSGWRLAPDEIAKILDAAELAIERVGTAVGGVGDATLESLASGAGFDGVVLRAYAEFLEEQSGRLTGMKSGYEAGRRATAAAANAYLEADEEIVVRMASAAEEVGSW